MYHLEGEMAFSQGASSLGKLKTFLLDGDAWFLSGINEEMTFPEQCITVGGF